MLTVVSIYYCTECLTIGVLSCRGLFYFLSVWYIYGMTIAVLKRAHIPNDDLVVIPRQEYEDLKARQIPAVFLKGRSARVLDKRVTNALREYRQGKTKILHSLRDLM